MHWCWLSFWKDNCRIELRKRWFQMIIQYFEKHMKYLPLLSIYIQILRELVIIHSSFFITQQTHGRGLLHFSIPGSPPRRNGCRFPLFWSEFPVSTIYHRSETRRISTTCLRIMKAINTLIAIVLLAVCQAVGSGFGCFEVSRSCFRCIFYQAILTDL